MTTKTETQKVVSIGLVTCDGHHYPPATAWDCPADQVGRLVEVGAVRLATRPIDIVPIRATAKDAIAQLTTIGSLEELEGLAANEERKTVIEAIDKRRAELENELYIAHLATIDSIEALEALDRLAVEEGHPAFLEAIAARRTELENQ